MLADELDYVVGVDPHRDRHAVAVVRAPNGQVLVEETAAATSGGYRSVLRLAKQHAPGRRAFAIEGTGSYGKGLARFLSERGERVLEVGRLKRDDRSRAKTDAIDAVHAAAASSPKPGRPTRARAANARRCGRSQ